MAKRQYESKIALAARNFVDVKEHVIENQVEIPEKKIEEEKVPSKPVEKKVELKDPKPAKEKNPAPTKKEEKTVSAVDDDAVAEKANALIKSLIESGQIQVKRNVKSGRPKKYEDETVLSSFRLTKTNYDYAYKMGRTKYASMTEYINHLIDEDINK